MNVWNSRLQKYVTLVRNVAGLKAWKVWLDSDMHICLLALAYSILTLKIFDHGFVMQILTLLVCLVLGLASGSLINDYCDMPYDKLSGKKRTIYQVPRLLIAILVVTLVSLNYVIIIFFIKQPVFAIISIVGYFLATFYSAPPIRLKERGVLGVLCNALMEKAIPVALVFSYFHYFHLDTLFFIILCFILQAEVIIHHQILDYEADSRTQTRTLVVETNPVKALQTLNLCLRPLTALFILVFCVIALVKIPDLSFALAILVVGFVSIRTLIKKKALIEEEKEYPLYFNYLYFCLVSTLPIYLSLLVAWNFQPYTFLTLLVIASQYYRFKYYFKPVRSFIRSCLHLQDSKRSD